MKLEHTTEKLDVSHCDLSGSQFDDVKLAGAAFTNVDMSGMRVEDVTLAGTTIRNVNLRGVVIEDCAIDGMRIRGLVVTDLIAAYKDSLKG